jgi:phosphoribosylglycinamide formyltransferase-1
MTATRLAVLLSGRGSNFLAIDDAIRRGELGAELVAVVSNRPDAPGLEEARRRGLAAFAFEQKSFKSREEHERAILEVLEPLRPDFVCLAGYMRRLTGSFVARFEHRMVNIHPSLLPAFPGVDAQAQAIRYGVKFSGCTVHFVDEGVDSGPIILQRVVAVDDSDDETSLSKKILAEEHQAYVEALQLLCSGKYEISERRVLRR